MQLAVSYQHFGDLHNARIVLQKRIETIFQINRSVAHNNLTKATLWAELASGAILESQPRRGLAFLNRALKSCP